MKYTARKSSENRTSSLPPTPVGFLSIYFYFLSNTIKPFQQTFHFSISPTSFYLLLRLQVQQKLKDVTTLGLPMTTPYGLVVQNIKNVQSHSILEVTKELARLHQLAVCIKLSTDDITGGTITLSNIGSIGGKFGSPILNLPEAAIIAIGKIQKLHRFSDDEKVYPAYVTNVTIGADHRIVDGAIVARFCNEWKLLIEKSELLLLHMR